MYRAVYLEVVHENAVTAMVYITSEYLRTQVRCVCALDRGIASGLCVFCLLSSACVNFPCGVVDSRV